MTEEQDQELPLEGALLQRLMECRPEEVLSKEAEPSDADLGIVERLHIETLGLLPMSLDPLVPSPSVKAELMRKIAVEGSSGAAVGTAVNPVESSPGAPADLGAADSGGVAELAADGAGIDELGTPELAKPDEPEVSTAVEASADSPSTDSRPPDAELEAPADVAAEETESAPSSSLFADAGKSRSEPELSDETTEEAADGAPLLTFDDNLVLDEPEEKILRFDDSAPYSAETDPSLSGAPPAAYGAASRPRRGLGSLALPLAAVFALLMSAVSVKLFLDVQKHEATIAELSQRAGTLSPSESLDATRENLSLVTAPGVEVCALKPVSESIESEVRGRLYVAPDHQHWYLAIQGLEPTVEGQSYQLWFLVGDERVAGGRFDVNAGEVVEMSDDTMPEGSRAVAVSLESDDESNASNGEIPDGEILLFGDEMVRLL